MKANELRIGNWYSEYGIPKQVLPLQILGLYQIEQAGKIVLDMTPIPLTEEWLVKLGFEKTDRDVLFYEKRNLVVEWLFERWTGRLYLDAGDSARIIEVKYVHQLQNLYFALTGEELSMNQLTKE
jgi:hypothetical protein